MRVLTKDIAEHSIKISTILPQKNDIKVFVFFHQGIRQEMVIFSGTED